MPNVRDLFGGAITADYVVPLIDASDLRQVPDTQEVYLSPQDGASYILDVLQPSLPASETPEQAIKQHFDNLAHDNSAHSAAVQQVSTFPAGVPQQGNTPTPVFLQGVQYVQKTGEGRPVDEVGIYLALWRLSPRKEYDLLLSLNIPRPHHAAGSVPEPDAVADPSAADKEAGAVSPAAERQYVEHFKRTIASLAIQDWGLFV